MSGQHTESTAETARTVLAESLRETLGPEGLVEAGEAAVVRAEVAVEWTDVLSWLRHQTSELKIYWSDREGEFEMAGVGAADQIMGKNTVTEALGRLKHAFHPGTRYYGGFRFNPDTSPDEHWDPFGSHAMILPQVELIRRKTGVFLACNVLLSNRNEADGAFAKADRALNGIRPAERTAMRMPRLKARHDLPDQAGWDMMIGQALETIGRHDLEKIVLARESRLEFDRRVDTLALLDRLASLTTRSHRFCFTCSNGCAFVGASPERLYRRRGRVIETEALAGTRPRGQGPSDAALRAELLADDKERREHRIVVDGIREALAGICGSVREDPAVSVLQLHNCQHLFETVEGVLAEDVTDCDVLRALHPTPAVGGTPTTDAIRWIAALEPFDRGWYAGPVGWIGRDSAEFAAAIRCGLACGDSLRVYSGAGIVAGSTADREWAEIETKMSNFLEALAAG
jgi:menaquinone-specific isochorismate synthase